MRYLTRKKWEGGGDGWKSALADYALHYKTIWDRLPSSMRQFEELQKRHTFHDEILIGYNRLSKDRVTLELQSWWIDFYEVELVQFDGDVINRPDSWLIDEVDVAVANKFRFMVLFQAAELDITAGIVQVYSRRERRIVVPTLDDLVTVTKKKKSTRKS